MLVQSFSNTELFEASCGNMLTQYGVELLVGTDFEEFYALARSSRPDYLIGDPFNPEKIDLTSSNAFWIVGRGPDGKIMHTQALRLIDLEAASVSLYFMRNFRAFPPPGMDIDFERSRYRAGPGAMSMEGCVAYHGEFWLDGSSSQYRGSGLSKVLSRYGFCCAMKKWDPDHIVAFMTSQVAHKGLAARAGWMHTDPSALRWFVKGQDKPIEGFLGYLHRNDIHFLLDIAVSEELPEAA